jgi:tetratricopeptide (TPR) repeat protein
VLFEGYSMLRDMAGYQAEDAQRRGRAEAAAERRAEAREYGRRAFAHCPSDRIASFGREIARELLADPRISESDRDLMVEAARKASEAAPRSADPLELLGRCLEKVGKPAEAAKVRARIAELDR